NYPATACAALAAASLALGDPGLMDEARARASAVLTHFSPEGFPQGEGWNTLSPKGLPATDLGYNVEETLSNLALYAHLAGDAAMDAQVEKSWRTHLAFALPDGAWDGGWSTRIYKWAYWGSRTTDGCQLGMALLADRDAAFAEVATRNAELFESCTSGGLLY